MAGIHGLKVRAANAHRHRMRTDPAYREVAQEVPVFIVPVQPYRNRRDKWYPVFIRDCYERRNTIVIGSLGRPMSAPQYFTMEEFHFWKNRGFSIPLDLVPRELWWAGDKPRFGEEALGDDF